LKLPAGRSVRLDITSADVQHSFWVPEWGGKVDAIPGRVNTLWFDLHDPASYTVRCAEYCGLSHYEMLADVEVVPAEAFDRWMDERIAERNRFEPMGADMATALPEGDPLRGEEWFIELGCGGCHSLDGSGGPQGPTLQGIGEAAATRVEGYTAGQYLRESILLPCEHLAGDYRCFMPQEYGERLDLQNLADLIAYLMAQ
jgi:cytochrome c oxidase subunit 2